MKIDKGIDLSRFILEEEKRYPKASGTLSRILISIENATKIISSHIRKAGLVDVLGKVGRINVQGEEVQKLDELANNWLVEHLASTGDFFAVVSEEMEKAFFPDEGKDGRYVICLDPLDGSSNVDVNISVGTIFSIYKRISDDDASFLQEGKKQVAAGYVIYGSSTMLVYSTGNGVNGFTLDPGVGSFILSHPNIKIPEKGKIYAFNESNYKKWSDNVKKYVDTVKDRGYTLRYVASMIADVHRTLLKGGIFAYPADNVNKNGKIRLLYEANPLGFLVTQAGGIATNGKVSILDVKPESLHQRTPIFMGSRVDMEEFLAITKEG
ncbi:Fructose-1,6-bisphosphatase class 1 [Thermodesulfobium narugense DSM 14796]|uniref:Fructose-1,6-bisphosphatase class 1 n=1 Tax=Thermodesulfobium narugense DSM 14796 TaxID=747365 RepID=M1E566_9BACT|nr:class 1 fructose-bisphosphatase [Thermodesulfobium narugense]AEE14071.1 Fructose-1,6-bisphosphatase class 1 [Thermodesulfobium narugense DSM 14796]